MQFWSGISFMQRVLSTELFVVVPKSGRIKEKRWGARTASRHKDEKTRNERKGSSQHHRNPHKNRIHRHKSNHRKNKPGTFVVSSNSDHQPALSELQPLSSCHTNPIYHHNHNRPTPPQQQHYTTMGCKQSTTAAVMDPNRPREAQYENFTAPQIEVIPSSMNATAGFGDSNDAVASSAEEERAPMVMGGMAGSPFYVNNNNNDDSPPPSPENSLHSTTPKYVSNTVQQSFDYNNQWVPYGGQRQELPMDPSPSGDGPTLPQTSVPNFDYNSRLIVDPHEQQRAAEAARRQPKPSAAAMEAGAYKDDWMYGGQ